MNLVFLLEERSAASFLDGFLPRILPEGVSFITIAHQGKSDLQKSIPRKLRAWRTPNTCFIVLHDQDSNDCKKLKGVLRSLCQNGGRPDTLVRIACRELEAWYLGDMLALECAFDGFVARRVQGRSVFSDVDAIVKPSDQLKRLVPNFQKVTGARAMADCIEVKRNGSRSFQVFVDGVVRLAKSGCQ